MRRRLLGVRVPTVQVALKSEKIDWNSAACKFCHGLEPPGIVRFLNVFIAIDVVSGDWLLEARIPNLVWNSGLSSGIPNNSVNF